MMMMIDDDRVLTLYDDRWIVCYSIMLTINLT
jgi:hypothetical protein